MPLEATGINLAFARRRRHENEYPSILVISPFGMSFCMPRLPELLCRAHVERLCSMSESGGLSAR
jgi:hypothetical protein